MPHTSSPVAWPAEIVAAARRIAPHVRITPCMDFSWQGAAVNLKLEYLQESGTFKARGAFNRLLSAPMPPAGVAAASGGNHGIAVALAARRLNVPAHIFVPQHTPLAKQERLHALGADVHLGGAAYADALAACNAFREATGALESHAYDHPATLAGQGTVAREWQHQAPDLDTVLVAVGGGGLIGGMAAWYQGQVKVVAVETEGCPTLHEALAAGRPVDVEVSGIAADSLGARRIGSLMFPIARQHIAQSLLVADEAVREAQQTLWREARIAAEPGGATAFAALVCGAYRPAADERVGVLICGANFDPSVLTRTAP
ncbi:MAG TPA: threonine/serine dehydratase [Burkholderiaceae bacterium]|jgi:threonine dehydratase|nr:threonine/serine dehydratase [Burkholderiaceae bacterium]